MSQMFPGDLGFNVTLGTSAALPGSFSSSLYGWIQCRVPANLCPPSSLEPPIPLLRGYLLLAPITCHWGQPPWGLLAPSPGDPSSDGQTGPHVPLPAFTAHPWGTAALFFSVRRMGVSDCCMSCHSVPWHVPSMLPSSGAQRAGNPRVPRCSAGSVTSVPSSGGSRHGLSISVVSRGHGRLVPAPLCPS